MQKQNLECKPEEVYNLKGDTARAQFVTHFKEVKRLKTGLDQYTDLSNENITVIENLLPEDQLRSFKSAYIETAKRLKKTQDDGDDNGNSNVGQLDFEFVLFASAVVDYDYIIQLISNLTGGKPAKEKMTKEGLINLLSSSANLMDERDDIVAYINSLEMGKPLSAADIERGYERFKEEKADKELFDIATQYRLETKALKGFVNGILNRMIFDGEKLNDLLAPLELGWKERAKQEQALMKALIPILHKLAQGRNISGLNAYE